MSLGSSARIVMPPLKYLNILRAEGIGSVRRRLQDRLQERSRRYGFRSLEHDGSLDARLPGLPVLNFSPLPLAARFGGVPLQLSARLGKEALERPVALLYPIGRHYRLEVQAGAWRRSLEFERPESLLPSSIGESLERVIKVVTARLRTTAVHFEGAAGVPLQSVLKLAQEGINFVFTIHDFAFFCSRPNLLEEPQLRFCDYSTDLTRCHACLSASQPTSSDAQFKHRELARQVMRAALALVYPSEFLQRKHQELFPEVDRPRRELVIEPALNLPLAAGPSERKSTRPYHVALVGSVTVGKGALIFEETVLRMRNRDSTRVRWSVFGGGEHKTTARLRGLPEVEVHGYFRAGTLPLLLRRYKVDLALLLSVVPESFGLTLSECWAAGVPVVAFAHGAVADRVRKHRGGVLVSANAGSMGIAETVEALARGEQVAPKIEGVAKLATPLDAATAYRRLYEELALLPITGG